MRLGDKLQAWARRPFGAGADCCGFVADIVEHHTGTNPLAGFPYSTWTQALALLDRYGGLEGALTASMGAPMETTQPRNGDVALIEVDVAGLELERLGPLAAVVSNGRLLYRTEHGLGDVSAALAGVVWRV